ncbi:MAG TPA: DUF4214 domain-containing protein [Noviherbaspirillum sp.]|nr:DUF4214 domain-containing protein [Noviherbaspirillum sp.]
MLRSLALIASAFLFLQLAGCGGGQDTSGSTASVKSGTASISAPYTFMASDYHAVVQQLYVAYFGRPADPDGLANFAAELSATDAPYDIQAFNLAYNRDARIRSLIDSFGISEESRTLYSGDTRAFIDAIYRNVLNRAPDADGLDFWVNAIDRGGLTRANASFSIMAGALANVSPQGRRDAALIDRRIAAASRFTAALATPALANSYRGNAAAAIARNMLATIVDTSDAAEIESAINPALGALTAQQGATPEVFSATVIAAPPDGTVIRGSERIELRGSGIRNAELLPAAGDLPIYARFNIASDFRSAWLDLDPRTFPNGPISFRVVAWSVSPGGTGQSVVAMPARTWTIQNAAPPPPFTAVVTQAPPHDANLTGVYTLEVRGTGLGNVELLPEIGYGPILGRFSVSRDKTSARLEFDTRIVPNYLLRARIVAFDVAPGNIGAREIVAMPARSWWLRNSPPPVGTAEGRAARCLSSGRAHTRLTDPFPVVCIYETATVPYEQCKDGWGMLYANPEDGLPVLRDGRFVSKLYCEPRAYNGNVNLGCSCN